MKDNVADDGTFLTQPAWSRVRVSSEFGRAPLVSVIVTNYNYRSFVRTCLASVGRQTYPNFECIVVDDRSTDGSVEEIAAFLEKLEPDARFRLVELTENRGQMNAFHEGFARAKGAFIVFLDADDFLFEDFLERHIAAHLNLNCTAAMTCSDSVIVDGSDQIIAGLRKGRASRVGEADRLSPDLPVECRLVRNWAGTWQFGENEVAIAQRCGALRYVAPTANFQRVWIWTSTSAVVFRRSALELTLTERTKFVRISADFYLFQFCHLLGGTILIPNALGAYRRHGANNFARDVTLSHRTITGEGTGYSEMWNLIREEVAANGDFLRALLGRPRFLGLISILYSLREFRAGRTALGYRDPVSAATLLVRMLLRHVGIGRRRLQRVFS